MSPSFPGLADSCIPDFRTLFDAMPTPYLILSPDFTIVEANAAYLKVALKEREEIIGGALFEIFPDNPNDPEATGSANLRASLERVLHERCADTMAIQRYDILVPGPEGSHFEVRYWNPVNSPVFDATGKLTHIIHRVEDVTGFALLQQRTVRLESEVLSQALEIQSANRRMHDANSKLEQRVAARTEQLLRSEQQAHETAQQVEQDRLLLETVLETAPAAIAVADASGALVHANPEFLRLWGRCPPLPCTPDEYHRWKGWWADSSAHHGQLLETHEWPGLRALRGEGAVRDLIEIETFDDPAKSRITVNSAAPIVDSAGNVTGAVIALVDITERVEAEQALKQADRRKDEFLAMLAHELRNPLAPIGAAADLLTMQQIDEKSMRRTAAIIKRQVRHMSVLLDDLLDASRVTRGLAKLAQQRIDLRHVVDDAIEQSRPLFEERQHQLEVCLAPQPMLVLGDYTRLVQVLSNLLNNAAKYTTSGGHVIVELDADANSVSLTVSDNGVGMSPEIVTRAFDLFTQAVRSSDRAQGGLGIGLALVKALVEQHGGTVTGESAGEGYGSRFTVRLPRLHKNEDAVPTFVPKDPFPPRSLNVLVVDDNVDAAQMLANLVEMMGNCAYIAHCPHEALARAYAQPPDVCLLDIGLPKMDGNELARNLRANPATAHAVLIAITGYGREHVKNLSLDEGFDHYFVKPVEFERLAELLRDISLPAA